MILILNKLLNINTRKRMKKGKEKKSKKRNIKYIRKV